MGSRTHNSHRRTSLGSDTTDDVTKVCDRLCQNDNKSEWGKKAIHLNNLTEYPFKLPSNNQKIRQTIGVIVSSFRAVPYG